MKRWLKEQTKPDKLGTLMFVLFAVVMVCLVAYFGHKVR